MKRCHMELPARPASALAQRLPSSLGATGLRGPRGFTLIELMITVAIVAILASIAYPSYQNQVRASARNAAQADMMELAQWMERRFTTNLCYHRSDNNCAAAPDVVLPFGQSPRTGAARYALNLVPAPTATTYVIQAVPQGAQLNDNCGTLTLNHLGVRGAAQANCW